MVTSYETEEDIVSLDTIRRLPRGGGVDPLAVNTVRKWCRTHADVYAGLVVSESTLYIGFRSEAREHLKALRELIPTITIRAFEAEHAYSDLVELVARISSDLPTLWLEGIEVAGVGIADDENRVVVNLVRDDSSWIDHLRQRYGDDFVIFRVTGRFYALRGTPPT